MKNDETRIMRPDRGELPDTGQYVLGHYNGGNWIDSDDQEGCEWVTVKFVKCDSEDDEIQGYAWESFGPDTFDGGDIDQWVHLPRLALNEGIPDGR